MVKNKHLLLVLGIISTALLYGCQTEINCTETLIWRYNNLKSISFQPNRIHIANNNYCGYNLYIKQWSPLPMAVRFDDDFLNGQVFQIKDTFFLMSSKGIISPFIFWNSIVPNEYSVKTTVISRYIEDNFKEGKSNDFDFTFSRDTLFSYNLDTIQRLRMKNFNRYHEDANLVLVISKKYGIEGIYISTNKSDGESKELIFTSEGNIYFKTIPNAVMFDPKHMSLD
jgi:hypothetical protein